MTMQTLTVKLPAESYPILIGQGLLSQLSSFAPYIHSEQVLLVSNETVAPLYLEPLKKTLSDYELDTLILPDGEAYKNLTTLNQIFDTLLAKNHHRDTTLIALGGGVIGDMTGFAAACYQRGVNFIQVPTTLLAQVDASVGGKTAVNHPLGKNMIGAFYQPQVVVIDTEVLTTLPARELKAGLAEVIKTALIADADFFVWLEENINKLRDGDQKALSHAIARCCAIKADIVAQDEKEAGVRALLNLGHTFGHAIETIQEYKQWLHGEAVAAGLVLAADLSMRVAGLPDTDKQRIEALIKRADLPIAIPQDISSEQLVAAMQRDKKVQGGKLRLILLKAIGKAYIEENTKQETLLSMLDPASS